MSQDFFQVPYHRFLGIEPGNPDSGEVELILPFREDNSNPGGTLHGGLAVSLINSAARLAAQQALGLADWTLAEPMSQEILYLSPVQSETARVRARIPRRGRGIAYAQVETYRESGEPAYLGLVSLRVPQKEPERVLSPVPAAPEWPTAASDLAELFIGMLTSSPTYVGRLAPEILSMAGGKSAARLDYREELSDGQGRLHPGAIGGLIDMVGATASFTLIDYPMRASVTPELHLNFFAPVGQEGVVAEGETSWQRDELSQVEVRVYGAGSGALVANASMVYRIT